MNWFHLCDSDATYAMDFDELSLQTSLKSLHIFTKEINGSFFDRLRPLDKLQKLQFAASREYSISQTDVNAIGALRSLVVLHIPALGDDQVDYRPMRLLQNLRELRFSIGTNKRNVFQTTLLEQIFNESTR